VAPTPPHGAPTVIAHRGASAAHPPGNTLAAFHAAGSLGATWVELDVRRTADDALAVHHDAQLPDGRSIVDLAAAALPDWVPLLGAALDACAGLGVNIEIKNSPGEADHDPGARAAEAVLALLAERSAGDPSGPYLVSSFDLATIDRVRALDPAIPTAYLVTEPTIDALDRAAGGGHGAIHPWYGLVTAASVEASRARGLAVNVWTVDDPDQIGSLAALGVDGVVTNVPDVAAAVLSAS
jgi:glycerophosphoryl diester phosphodiesterase